MRLRSLLLAATLLAGAGGAAIAQMPSASYDPQQLPAMKGRVAQYSLTPRGDVDGLILEDGTQVHLPPHLGTQLTFAVKPGDAVTVRGLKARAIPVVQGAQVTNEASGQSVTDTGPPGGWPHRHHEDGQPLEAQGRVKAQLYGPRGDLNGVILEDGTQVHLPPPEAQRLAAQLAPGQTLYVSGVGMASPLGKVIGARAIGPSATQLTQIAAPWHDHEGPGHDGPGRDGPGRHGFGHEGFGRERHGPPPPVGPGAPPPAPPETGER